MNELGALSLDELLNIRAPSTYLVRVEGDSMQGAGIFSGDLLVVDKGSDPARRAIVIAVVNGEPLCKRLDYENGAPVLRSENPRYASRYVLEGDEFSVWGGVRHSIRAHN
ncbi:LexA family protein [Pseudomonas amygdali]|uniref:LexA family protein n=1 Tax=Pseudomonas amygdali TaxID=47877 RepID=UPI001FB7E106|nr:S24 family peptidase [Pseudomonas amygdali]